MAKKYINGYDKPRFIVRDANNNVIADRTIPFKYEALKEYYERITVIG